MQQAFDAFFAVLLAYFISDSLLQVPFRPIDGSKPLLKYIFRGLFHLIILTLILAIFARSTFEPSVRLLWIPVYVAVIASLDYLRIRGRRAGTSGGNPWVYAIVQTIQVCAVLILALLLSGSPSPTVATIVGFFDANGSKILSALTIYVGTLFAGGFFIRQLTRPLADHLGDSEIVNGGLPNAGMYIGWLERCLIVTAVLMQSTSTVGFILAGKSIARFPEMKDPRFAEYFLIGTFLSFAVALLGGMLIQWTWTGSVRLI